MKSYLVNTLICIRAVIALMFLVLGGALVACAYIIAGSKMAEDFMSDLHWLDDLDVVKK